MELYSIKDKVGNKFGPLMEQLNDAVAIRTFKQMMKDNPFSEDYELHYIGGFKESDGTLFVYERKDPEDRIIFTGIECKVLEKEKEIEKDINLSESPSK